MKNAQSIRKRLDAIQAETDVHKAINKLAEVTFDIGIDACSERVEMCKQIDSIRIAVLGDGDPTKSIISKMERFEACTKEIQLDLNTLKTFLIGDLTKGGESHGLKDRLQKVENNLVAVEAEVEKISSHLAKLNWIIIAAVIAQILASIFLH